MTVSIVLGAALIASNFFWWLHVRHLSGVTSDLQDAVSDVKNVADKVNSAANQAVNAAQTIAKG